MQMLVADTLAGVTAEDMEYNDYDRFAQAYGSDNETSPFNADYERPAILALIGPVRGLRVLDAGCGTGAHADELLGRGATVTGVDSSVSMLDIARARLGPSVLLHHTDLSNPLPFPDSAFDIVLSSLVMHYLSRWEPTLCEFRRVLAPGGRLVLSTHHPFMDMRISGSDDYFQTYPFTEDWIRDGHVMAMRFWHRPLRDMLTAFKTSGFTVTNIVEPEPQRRMAGTAPESYQHLTRKPQFILFDLTAN